MLSVNMVVIAIVHALLSPPILVTIVFVVLIFTGLGLFAVGYFFAGGHPQKMHYECERFLFLAPTEDFGIFHWKRSTIIFVDTLLVIIPTALGAWGITHDIFYFIAGTGWTDIVPALHFPISTLLTLWFSVEVMVDVVLFVGGVLGLIWEIRTWVDGRKGDTCFMMGMNTVYPRDGDDAYHVLDPRGIAGFLGATPDQLKNFDDIIDKLQCKLDPKLCKI